MKDKIPTVFVVDDDEAVRDALAVHMELAGLPVRTFASAREFLSAIGPDHAGCAVLDIRMPEMDGLTLQREMAACGITLPVIVVTGHGDVPAAVSAFRAGAVDFLQKPFDEDHLIERIREALERDGKARRQSSELAQLRRLYDSLTPREREVLELIALGCSNKVVALRLDIGVRTVETHRAKVLEKMGAHSASELARMKMKLDGA